MRFSVLLPACLLAVSAAAQEAPDRVALDELAARLEFAARRVSVPAPAFLGGTPTRAYRLPGVGAVVVLAPRLLSMDVPDPTAPSPQPVASAPQAPDPQASRVQLERALFELRNSLERTTQAAVTGGDLRSLERQAQQRLAAAARARAEAFRALSQAMSETGLPWALQSDPSPLGVGLTSSSELLAARGSSAAPAEVLARVRAAVRDALPTLLPVLSSLPETESLSVAVDFVSVGNGPGLPARRTMVLRARLSDVRAAAIGQRPGTRPEDALEVLEY